MGHDIFISHSSEDETVARDVCVELEDRGLEVWIAPRDITGGENWGEAIYNGIRSAEAVLLLMSERANQSRETKREIKLADEHEVPIIPVVIEDAEVPGEFKYYLATIQRLHIDNPITDKDYNRIIRSIVSNTDIKISPDTKPRPNQDEHDLAAGKKSESENSTEDVESKEKVVEIEDWHDLNAMRQNLDGEYQLVNDLDAGVSGYDEHIENPRGGWEPIGDMPLTDINQQLESDTGGFRQLFFEAVMEKFIEKELSELGKVDITEVGEEVTEKTLKEALVEVAIELGVDPEEEQGKTSGETYEAIEEFLQRKTEYIDLDEIEEEAYRRSSFSGSLYGNGYAINDLVVDRPNRDGVGLFSVTAGATITDVKSENTKINGGGGVGGLVGVNAEETEIREAKIKGDVNGETSTGGLVGLNTKGEVQDSTAECNVNGENMTAGLVGVNTEEAVVAGSTAECEVDGEDRTGGLVGINVKGEVRDSTAECNVDGDICTGGLVGKNAEEAVIADSTAESDVDGRSRSGGLVGENTEGAVVADSTAESEIGGYDMTGGLVGKNTDEAVVQNSTAESDIREKYRNCIGGLVGKNSSAYVQESEARSDIEGSKKVGGLVGMNEDGAVVQDSTAESTVEGSKKVGGLVGMNEDGAIVQDSTAESTVEGDEDTGRLVGLKETDDDVDSISKDRE